jgi:glycosyltransferase involved in cell wall biosynthesis
VKLAFVTSLAPTEKPDTGFEIANAAILDALRAAGHQVTVVAFARHDDRLKPDPDLILIGRITIENHAAGPLRKLGWLAASLVKGMPFASAKLWLAGGGRVPAPLRERGRFDRIILNSVMMPGAFPELVGLGPTVLVAHNIEHVSASQNAGHARNSLMRWLYRREARKLKRLETTLAAASDYIWCLAEDDRQSLAALAGRDVIGRSAVLPLVSASRSATAAVGADEPLEPIHDVGLIGTWTWEPNLIGLKWFLDEVVPLLPRTLRIAVAGRIPAELDVPPNVELVGRVPDAAAFLGGCAVVALASRAGTGVQLKTIEALQLGLPAVATTLSMRGLGQPPANVRLADDPADFAGALVAQVAGVAAGDVKRSDGEAFMQAQAKALATAISAGLDARTVAGREGGKP